MLFNSEPFSKGVESNGLSPYCGVHTVDATVFTAARAACCSPAINVGPYYGLNDSETERFQEFNPMDTSLPARL